MGFLLKILEIRLKTAFYTELWILLCMLCLYRLNTELTEFHIIKKKKKKLLTLIRHWHLYFFTQPIKKFIIIYNTLAHRNRNKNQLFHYIFWSFKSFKYRLLCRLELSSITFVTINLFITIFINNYSLSVLRAEY